MDGVSLDPHPCLKFGSNDGTTRCWCGYDESLHAHAEIDGSASMLVCGITVPTPDGPKSFNIGVQYSDDDEWLVFVTDQEMQTVPALREAIA